MSYPRVERINNDSVNEVTLSFYESNHAIEINKKLCTGCSVCVKICPKGALVQNRDGKIKVKTEDLIPEIPDADKCSYCGTCAYMCPFSAITLKKNGSPVALEDIPLVKEKVLPKLEHEILKCKKKGQKAKIYVEGSVEIDWNSCISCMSCYEVCPNSAFFKAQRTNKLGKAVKLDINVRAACLYCGACETACPQKAITVHIDKVKYSGEYKEIFWSDLIKRSKGKR
ncbi:MAG: 4Fe-4S binding protein [Promethearchaeota archaeon]|jgi:formate hydrogenlyase subunit 6/NADH:ubiquinone oxidoreductase subunit I